MIRSCSLKPQQIYEPASVKQTISSQFFSSFELRGITKHLMTGPARKSDFCFPKTFNVSQGEAKGTIEVKGKKTHRFPWASHSVLTVELCHTLLISPLTRKVCPRTNIHPSKIYVFQLPAAHGRIALYIMS